MVQNLHDTLRTGKWSPTLPKSQIFKKSQKSRTLSNSATILHEISIRIQWDMSRSPEYPKNNQQIGFRVSKIRRKLKIQKIHKMGRHGSPRLQNRSKWIPRALGSLWAGFWPLVWNKKMDILDSGTYPIAFVSKFHPEWRRYYSKFLICLTFRKFVILARWGTTFQSSRWRADFGPNG